MKTYYDYGTYILRRAEGLEDLIISIDPENPEYQYYISWVMEGNAIQPPIMEEAPTEVEEILPTLEEVKTGLKIKAEVFLLEKLDRGFEFNGKMYPADLPAQTSLINQWDWYLDTGNPSLLGFKAKSKEWITMTEEEFKQFKLVGRAFVLSLYQTYWNVKDVLIEGALSIEEAKTILSDWKDY